MTTSKTIINFAPVNRLERCRSGRSGRSRKPLYPYGYPGFESLSFRKYLNQIRCKSTTYGGFDFIYIQKYIQIDGTAATPGAEVRGPAPHQHGGEPDNGGEGQVHRLQGALKSSRDILNIIADILYKASEVFRRAIEAIIHFATELHKSIFSPSEAADIKSVMQSYGKTIEQQKAVGTWLCDYAEHRQPFYEIKHRHTLNEVGDVAEGRYDWKIERGRGSVISI